METKKLMSIVHGIVPEPSELDFDKAGIIRKPKRDIDRIGVCVDLTDHVMDQAAQQRIDFLIIYHGHGKDVRDRVRKLGVGAYGLHLALNVAEGGLIDSLAKAIAVTDKELLPLTYKNYVVGKGALLGRTRNDRGGFHCGRDVHEFAESLRRFYCDNLGYDEIRTYNLHLKRTVSDVIVSVRSAGREEFIDQIIRSEPFQRARSGCYGCTSLPHIALLIAGSATPGAIEMARNDGLMVLTVGDYESCHPGITQFTSRLDKRVYEEASALALFLPNDSTVTPIP